MTHSTYEVRNYIHNTSSRVRTSSACVSPRVAARVRRVLCPDPGCNCSTGALKELCGDKEGEAAIRIVGNYDPLSAVVWKSEVGPDGWVFLFGVEEY